MAGFFGLDSAQAQLRRMKAELERLREKPGDRDAAVDFFTAAEHMLDYCYPGGRGSEGQERRKSLRKSEALLAVCSHLANASKHHDKLLEHHDSVESTVRSDDVWGQGVWAVDVWGPNLWSGDRWTIRLRGKAADELGSEITALDLAERLIDYWQKEIEAGPKFGG
jgi:hypothetical protein